MTSILKYINAGALAFVVGFIGASSGAPTGAVSALAIFAAVAYLSWSRP